MQRQTERPTDRPRATPLLMTLALALAACGGKASGAPLSAAIHGNAPASRVVACTLMPKEAINALVGEAYTTTESNDDGHSSSSDCHYSTATNPAGMSIGINWIEASEYDSPAEHAALQRASIAGARLGGKLGTGVADPGATGMMPSGPVAGVGDEATTSLMLLTARKGDYTVHVQIIPTDMFAMMTDSTVATALLEKEKAVARAVLAKL